MDLSVIVPCFNEEETIEIFYKCALNEVLNIKTNNKLLDFEFIFVDDGSTDSTLAIMKQLNSIDHRARYLSLSRNFGKESAIFAGIEHATGDLVAVIDADMQDPPEMLPVLYDSVNSGESDIARLRRINREGEPFIRSFLARSFYKVINAVSDIDLVDGARDYQLMNRKAVNAILSIREYNRFFKGITTWIGFKVRWFEYKNVERVSGESKWNIRSLFKYAFNGITAFSTSPLDLASVGGMSCFGLSAILILFIVIRAILFGDPVAGWPSLICVMLLIGGLQLLCQGILGNYLAKAYLEAKHRPIYLLEESSDPIREYKVTCISEEA